MKNNYLLVLLTLLCTFSCTTSNKKNPAFIAKEYGDFDLDKITFTERMDTLFSKVRHREKLYVYTYERLANGDLEQVSDQEGDEDTTGRIKRDTLGYIGKILSREDAVIRFHDFVIDNDNQAEFYFDTNKDLMYVNGYTQVQHAAATQFMKGIRARYKNDELFADAKPDQLKQELKLMDDIFIYKKDNGIVVISINSFKGETYKGEAMVFYDIYKYPNNNEVFLRLHDNKKLFQHYKQQ